MDPNQLVPQAPKPAPPQNLNLVITPDTSFHSVATQVLRQQQALEALQLPLTQQPIPQSQPVPAPQLTQEPLVAPLQQQQVQLQALPQTTPLQNQVLPSSIIARQKLIYITENQNYSHQHELIQFDKTRI